MKKAKIFYTLLVAAFIFWPFISALADVKSPEGNANPGFSKEAAGNCIFQAGGGCGAGAWFANPASQCAWEHCCKSHLYGYPTTDYTYQFKNQCSNKTDSGGNYEFEDPNKADCGTGWDCCCSTPPPAVNQNTTPPPAAPKFTIPTFQVPIDTVKLTEAVCTSTADGTYLCQVPWIGEYITGIYNYGLSVAGILAAIMLMAGGLLWLISGGDVGKITQAKELIVGSVTGLIILAASFIILVQINPNLVKFNPLSIGTIKGDTIPIPQNTATFSTGCKAQTTGACAVANMVIFGDKASQASGICNAESGGNASIFNSLTKCAGGEYAVWGLFQFNLSANDFVDANNNTLHCAKAFNHAWVNSTHNCTVIDTTLYNQCVQAAKNASLSILNAKRLVGKATNWGPWETNSKLCHFQN